MASDINGTVVAIQGNPVEAETLGANQDGYVLTWSNADTQIQAQPSVGLQSQIFTSNGTWTCPANVYNIWLTGWGGGGGGGGGIGNGNYSGGSGGGGALRVSNICQVVPGTEYSIVIGAGGSGGTAGKTGVGQSGGSIGGTTYIEDIFYAAGASNGFGAAYTGTGYMLGGSSVQGTGSPITQFVSDPNQGQPYFQGGGGFGSQQDEYSGAGNWNEGSPGGSAGSSEYGGGGGGGGAGPGTYPNGNGGNGGASGNNTTGGNGSAGVVNSGAGGGGGGGTSSNNYGGSGGNGGSGQLTIAWIG